MSRLRTRRLRGKRAPRASTTRHGAASVELVAIAPFLLLMMAAIWDIRAFTAHRADLAREVYVVAELIANGADWDIAGVRNAIAAAMARLSGESAGWMRVVVVTREQDIAAVAPTPPDPLATPPTPGSPGSPRVEATNGDGRDCDDTAATADDPSTLWDDTTVPWCEPIIRLEVQATAGTANQWSSQAGTTNCANVQSQLPVCASPPCDFSGQAVLPQEGTDPDGAGPATAPPEAEWPSRRLADDEWWVVVETCSHFGGGTSQPFLAGGLFNFATDALNVRNVLYRRVAWGAVADLANCRWC